MAYTQNPGRGNNSKTGHGIPSPLLQGSNSMDKEKKLDPKTYVGPEERNQVSTNAAKKAEGYTYKEVQQAKKLVSKGNFDSNGTKVNVKSGEITKSPYAATYVKKSDGDEVYKGGKLIKKADPTNKDTKYLGASGYENNKQSKSNEQLKAGFKSDSLSDQDRKGRLGQIVRASIDKARS